MTSSDDERVLRHLADTEHTGPIRLPSGRIVRQLPPDEPPPAVEHHTETKRYRGDGSLDYRVDREYHWICTCGASGEPTSYRTAATEEGLKHERDNR